MATLEGQVEERRAEVAKLEADAYAKHVQQRSQHLTILEKRAAIEGLKQTLRDLDSRKLQVMAALRDLDKAGMRIHTELAEMTASHTEFERMVAQEQTKVASLEQHARTRDPVPAAQVMDEDEDEDEDEAARPVVTVALASAPPLGPLQLNPSRVASIESQLDAPAEYELEEPDPDMAAATDVAVSLLAGAAAEEEGEEQYEDAAEDAEDLSPWVDLADDVKLALRVQSSRATLNDVKRAVLDMDKAQVMRIKVPTLKRICALTNGVVEYQSPKDVTLTALHAWARGE